MFPEFLYQNLYPKVLYLAFLTGSRDTISATCPWQHTNNFSMFSCYEAIYNCGGESVCSRHDLSIMVNPLPMKFSEYLDTYSE